MDNLEFAIAISARPEDVWRVLHADDEFRIWAAIFCEGSYRTGDWNAGGTVRFLTPDGMGMISLVEESRPNELLLLKNVGVIRDGVDDTESAEARVWTPTHESYRLTQIEGGTKLRMTVEIPGDYREFFEETWPRALGCIKQMAEAIKG